ncbi:GIP [Symbiodinium natans]|uniref:GIP protein n=1 Tax=Symbiodinium natans TaxID=878477 RepID=A0A812PSN7_9DINO|nr:GIP [Symbiodinium natans]
MSAVPGGAGESFYESFGKLPRRDVNAGGHDQAEVDSERRQWIWSGSQDRSWWGHSWGSGQWVARDWGRGYDGQERQVSKGETWGTTASLGSGSVDDGGDRDVRRAVPEGWQPQKLGSETGAPRGDLGRGPSEKMVVPSFSGSLEPGSGEDLGATACSYLRQVAAWRRMTRLGKSQQALTLYQADQALTGKAWADAERLDMDRLASDDGIEYYISWVKDRYLDVQVTQVGRSLSDFFRRLKRRGGQSIRDYMSDFDRALARLNECGCVLPDLAAAWVFVDRMELEEGAELNLLASVGNQYNLKALQQAAIVQDRALRKPWEGQGRGDRNNKREWWPKKIQSANMADAPETMEDADDSPGDDGDQAVPEAVAAEYYEAYITHESAKNKYKASLQLRGSDPETMRELAAQKLSAAKSKSFCAGCHRRGHWHKDACCPLNKGKDGGNAASSSTGATTSGTPPGGKGAGPRSSYACHVVHVTWDLENDKGPSTLAAITDTACSKSVAGLPWIEHYITAAEQAGYRPIILECKESFKFGASRVFEASYAMLIGFALGNFEIWLKVAVVKGDVPLLVSRPALGHLGMVLDVERNTATFRALQVADFPLLTTETGHPALPVRPVQANHTLAGAKGWSDEEIRILPRAVQYMVGLQGQGEGSSVWSSMMVFDVEELSSGESVPPLPLPRALDLDKVVDSLQQKHTLLMKTVHVLEKNEILFQSKQLEHGASRPEVVTRQKGLWELTRDELLREAEARRLTIHPRWTVTEIRSVIQEDLAKEGDSETPMPHLNKMNLEELEAAVGAAGIELPSKYNREILMRLLRDNGGMGPQTLMNFGRYQGMMFSHTPHGYRAWAIKEMHSNENASEDLKMYATWCEKEEKKTLSKTRTPEPYIDPETNAKIPYVPEEENSSAWSLVPPFRGYLGTSPKARAGPLNLSEIPHYPLTPPRNLRRPAPSASGSQVGEMEEDMDPEHEIANLERRSEEGGAFQECLEGDGEVPGPAENKTSPNTQEKIKDYDIGEDDDFTRECLVGDHYGPLKTSKDTITEKEVIAKCEEVAKAKLQSKSFEYGDLLEVLRKIPMKGTRRHRDIEGGRGAVAHSLVGGLYSHGSKYGITKRSMDLPWTTRFINACMKSKVNGSWTSFALLKGVQTSVHKDVHNIPGRETITISLGNFSGGELWVHQPELKDSEEAEVVWKRDPTGDGSARLPGVLLSTKENPTSFDPRNYHATEDWDGERWCLSLFCSRGYPQITEELREHLRDLRFPLRGLPAQERSDSISGPTERPRKSTRKLLWQRAKRLASLTTWCTMAASLCTTEILAAPRGVNSVALMELGGWEKTIELGTHDFLTTEPLTYEDVSAKENHPTDMWKELQPATLWIHGVGDDVCPSSVGELARCQTLRGRGVVVEAEQNDNIWNEEWVLEVADLGDMVKDEVRDGRRTLSVNREDNDIFKCSDEAVKEKMEAYLKDKVENAYVVEAGKENTTGVEEGLRGASAISFRDEKNISSEVKTALRRLHQNLGHPDRDDLARHLRMAGAGPEVIQAVKRMSCQVCERNKRGLSAKPASFPTLLEFNQVVALDAFSSYDSTGTRYEFMMALDLGTGFGLASSLQGHSSEAMEATFNEMWCQVFGPPSVLALDLESGLQAGLARFSEWHGTKLRPIAAQAHYQQGAVERHIRLWKEVWAKIVDEHAVIEEDVPMAITSVNTALNTLKRDSGFSPSQAVWGRDPVVPEEVLNGPHGEHLDHVLSKDRRRAKEMSIRSAAKEAYFKCHRDAKFRRALLQRSRVAGPELQVGDHVYMYRKPKNQKTWYWYGPAVIIGREGPNYWTSFGGRCHLVAPEHIRLATGEEIGQGFILRTTKEDLARLLEADFKDEDLFVGTPGEAEGDPELLQSGDPERGPKEPREHPPEGHQPVRKRVRTKGPAPGPGNSEQQERAIPEDEATRMNHVHMAKRAPTRRSREKALEKEIPWSLVPEEQRDQFRQAERKQYDEHLQYRALEPLDVETSREVSAKKGERVLDSRFAYRDKNWSKRRKDPGTEWKPKSRLVISGHRDPDLLSGLSTHAPTISRQGIHLLLQILASNLKKGWTGHAGDVTAAFLSGEELERELYLRQPRSGLGDLHPEQLLRIRKGIFGLVDSPSSWWKKLKKTLKELEIEDENKKRWRVTQCSLDHCIFMVQAINGEGEDGTPILGPPEAYLGVHVDDILLVGEDRLCQLIKQELSSVFPIHEWETGSFDYVGSFIEIGEDQVTLSQSSYVNTRLFTLDIKPGQVDWESADEEQRHDNMSLIGALSWLASQSRPDLQVGVSLSQQCQRQPTVGDLKFTNLLVKRALEHQDQGVVFRSIDLEKAVLLCYHDAGWANCPQSQEDPYYSLTFEEEKQGLIQEGPYAIRERKAKRANSSIASQIGSLFVLANEEILSGSREAGSILDWKSGACDRVCRSTFAAETMACASAIETGEYILKFLESLLRGSLYRKGTTRFKARFLSDCRSLFDHLTREGVPRVPSCKRLAIDLAAIRDDLECFGRLAWIPTGSQMADLLTKPLKSGQWWAQLREGIKLTFREDLPKQCKAVEVSFG